MRCPNCGLPSRSAYCPHCGQYRIDGRLRTGRILADVFDNLFGLESRLLRTIRALTRNPGRVAAEWVGGRRVHYANPFRYCIGTLGLYVLAGTLLGFDVLRGAGISVEPAGSLASDQTRGVAREVAEFLARNFSAMFLAAVPAFGLSLLLLFRGSGRNYAETMVFVFYAVGHACLLTALVSAGAAATGVPMQALGSLLLLVYLAAGSATFFGGNPVRAGLKSALAYVVYLAAVLLLALAAAAPAVLLRGR